MGAVITDFEVVNGHDRLSLVNAVNALISDGWQPYGCIQVSTPVINEGVSPMYTQAMVKYKQ